MSHLNPVELRCKEAISLVLMYWTRTSRVPVGVQEFMGIMEKVRMASKFLANKEYGCWSGIHAGRCTCKPDKPGTRFL